MIRSVRNDIIDDREYNYFNYVITPQIRQLFNSETTDEFYNNFKQCVSYEYNIVISNLIKIKNLQQNQKFYFDDEFNIQIHSNYFGSWTTSTYRYIVGLGRDSSFNDLEHFIKEIKLLIDRTLIVNYKHCIPKIKLDILKSHFKNIKKGLLKLKETYNNDNNILSIIDKLIVLI